MRPIARIGLTLAVMVAVAPATATAQSQPALAKPWNQIFHRHKKTATADKVSHLCNNCNRDMVKKRDGVEIPPVPPMPAGMTVNTGPCSKCKKPVLVVREEVMPPPSYFNVRTPASEAPVGVAVASDDSAMGQSSLVSAEPFPIGVYQQRVASTAPAANPGMRGTGDPSVMTTSAVMPPASNPIAPPGHNRPHVLSHLFGFSEFGKERAQDRERRDRESHASVQYGPANQVVSELPAKMVYGK